MEKILRLAKDEAATEEERNAAMGRAQEIAFKHNIDLLDIDTEEAREGVIRSDWRWAHEWEEHLLSACAMVNFCRTAHFLGRDASKRRPAFIYGKKHNIEATMDLFEYLHQQVVLIEIREVAKRDKRMQYARKVLIEVVKDLLPTHYMKRVLEEHEDAYFDERLDRRYVNAGHDSLVEAAAMYLQGNDHILKGNEGLRYIMDRTGLTASYASEIRPYLRRGEYAPEIVKNMGVWRRSFELGMVNQITNRLLQKYEDLLQDAGDDGKALVVKEDAGLDDFDKEMDTSEASKNKMDPRGLIAGAIAGTEVSLEQYQSLTSDQRSLNA